MFETLDIMISIAVIFLIFSMANKYAMSLFKRLLKIKAGAVSLEMKAFVGEKTSQYLTEYLSKYARSMNFTEKTIFSGEQLRELNKDQLQEALDGFKKFTKDNGDDIDLIASKLGIKDEIKDSYGIVKEQIANLESRAEAMYDNTVARIEKRVEGRMRYWTLGFGMLIAFSLNIDFLKIYSDISRDGLLRNSIVAQAESVVEEYDMLAAQQGAAPPAGDSISGLVAEGNTQYAEYKGMISKAGLQIGWTMEDWDLLKDNDVVKDEAGDGSPAVAAAGEKRAEDCKWNFGAIINKLFGLLLSGLLISFGAPFWHDFLTSIMGIKKTIRGKGSGGGGDTTKPEEGSGDSEKTDDATKKLNEAGKKVEELAKKAEETLKKAEAALDSVGGGKKNN